MNSFQLIQQAVLRDMTRTDLPAIVRIEQRVHAYPWSCGNFMDSLNSNDVCKIYEAGGELLGYVIFMLAVDEGQLLNISVAVEYQCLGLGRGLLEAAMEIARGRGMHRMTLEVRPSNLPALALYRGFGFHEAGRRCGYYRSANGCEDAIVMEYAL
ncbi:ribosomal protein S18-alanine N-acetyltransferase [Candidatus Nitrotoga fabula]|uniref:[Ribosomal protein bS18]-alanine N-acetyltransferase n=1 Tax=Candidatus Nitrotoga fabula TaxID=2182327 RepID=A0A916BEE9_9PROT|nr:ribosomal protein S18-alanine N-acetyltransferase [Candidatus Nitrotoga fabula]CAE6730128.1 (Ribosomal protein S18)-alanine N-acetyltransferase [Candidatus Nitrotoga fabula]